MLSEIYRCVAPALTALKPRGNFTQPAGKGRAAGALEGPETGGDPRGVTAGGANPRLLSQQVAKETFRPPGPRPLRRRTPRGWPGGTRRLGAGPGAPASRAPPAPARLTGQAEGGGPGAPGPSPPQPGSAPGAGTGGRRERTGPPRVRTRGAWRGERGGSSAASGGRRGRAPGGAGPPARRAGGQRGLLPRGHGGGSGRPLTPHPEAEPPPTRNRGRLCGRRPLSAGAPEPAARARQGAGRGRPPAAGGEEAAQPQVICPQAARRRWLRGLPNKAEGGWPAARRRRADWLGRRPG